MAHLMNSLHTMVAVLTAVSLIGSASATSLQEALAQGIIVDYKEEFSEVK